MAIPQLFEFTSTAKSQNTSQVEKLLNEIKDAQITLHNYKEWIPKVVNISNLIIVQIENLMQEYITRNEEYKILKEDDGTKKLKTQQLVPDRMHDCLKEMHYYLRQIATWKFYENEIAFIIIGKLDKVMATTNALDIEREVFKRYDELDERKNAMFTEIITEYHKSFENNFIAGLKELQNESRLDRKENTLIMRNALQKGNAIMVDALRELFLDAKRDKYLEKIEQLEEEEERDIAGKKEETPIEKVVTVDTEYKANVKEKYGKKKQPPKAVAAPSKKSAAVLADDVYDFDKEPDDEKEE